MFLLIGTAVSSAFYWRRDAKQESVDADSSWDEQLGKKEERPESKWKIVARKRDKWCPRREQSSEEAAKSPSEAARSAQDKANSTKVVASLTTGEIFAEVVICVSSTVDDLAAAILKKANVKASTHILSIRQQGAEVAGKNVLRDLGMKPLMHSSVTVMLYRRKTIKISFQPSDAPKADGYLVDSGEKFCDRGGVKYGWSHDNTDGGRKRARLQDAVLDTFVIPDRAGKYGRSFHWKIALEPGDYEVAFGCSDPHPVYGRKDGNAGRLNGSPFDVGKGSPNKELATDVVLTGRELRLEGSYASGLSAPSYIHICGGSLPRDESKGDVSNAYLAPTSFTRSPRKEPQ
jgi:hypothetical protein